MVRSRIVPQVHDSNDLHALRDFPDTLISLPNFGDAPQVDLKYEPTSDTERRLVAEFTRPDGSFDKAGMGRRVRHLKRELRRVQSEKERREAQIDTLNRFVSVADGMTAAAQKKPFRLLQMRSKLKPEFFVGVGDEREDAPPIQMMREAPWFDFRHIPIKSSADMVAFGKELVAEGIVRLPFDTTVFAFPFKGGNGTEITALMLLQQGDKHIENHAMLFFGTGKPVGVHGGNMDAQDAVFYALAVLSSRASESRKKSVSDETEVADSYRGDSYFEVSLRASAVNGAGTGHGHASPRLHWRRGHIRRIGNRTTWVRATLVGKSENGVVVHDYADRP